MRGICRLAVDVEKGYNGAPQVSLLALLVQKYRYCLCAASVAWLCTLHFLTGIFFFVYNGAAWVSALSLLALLVQKYRY